MTPLRLKYYANKRLNIYILNSKSLDVPKHLQLQPFVDDIMLPSFLTSRQSFRRLAVDKGNGARGFSMHWSSRVVIWVTILPQSNHTTTTLIKNSSSFTVGYRKTLCSNNKTTNTRIDKAELLYFSQINWEIQETKGLIHRLIVFAIIKWSTGHPSEHTNYREFPKRGISPIIKLLV